MRYIVRIPYHSYTEQIIEADNEEQAEEIAIATNCEDYQLLDNIEQDGNIDIEEIQ